MTKAHRIALARIVADWDDDTLQAYADAIAHESVYRRSKAMAGQPPVAIQRHWSVRDLVGPETFDTDPECVAMAIDTVMGMADTVVRNGPLGDDE